MAGRARDTAGLVDESQELNPVSRVTLAIPRTLSPRSQNWVAPYSLGLLGKERKEIKMSVADVVSELDSKLGQEVHTSAWLEISQKMIDNFAQVTKDHQWIHVDADRATRESPFGTTVAHGFLTLSLIPYLTGSVNPDKPAYPDLKLAVNYGLNRVRFPHPVRSGSKVRTHTKLLTAQEVGEDCLQIVNEITIEIEGAPKPGCVAETVARFYF